MQSAEVRQLWAETEPLVKAATSLDDAAQSACKALHEAFEQSVVLARIFVTARFRELPPRPAAFATTLAKSNGMLDALKPDTMVLCLLGTHGQERAWQNRRESEGHIAIPLLSAEFVRAIPMVAQLIKQLGLDLSFVGKDEFLKQSQMAMRPLFFVEHAAQTTDAQGRNIISAQQFVADYGVDSVFGGGAAYLADRLAVLIVFTRDSLKQRSAELWLPFIAMFGANTSTLAASGKLFS